MAHSLSARKRVRQNEKNRARNRWRKSRIKEQVKQFLRAVHDGDADRATEEYRKTTKTLDKIAATGTIHKNTAARRKSRLAKRLHRVTGARA